MILVILFIFSVLNYTNNKNVNTDTLIDLPVNKSIDTSNDGTNNVHTMPNNTLDSYHINATNINNNTNMHVMPIDNHNITPNMHDIPTNTFEIKNNNLVTCNTLIDNTETVLNPIDNNIINPHEIDEQELNDNYHEFIHDNAFEEHSQHVNNNNFNYIKDFSDDFHGYDSNELYPLI